MAMRRQPMMGGGGGVQTPMPLGQMMAGGMPPPSQGPMQPKPPMTGAPAGNANPDAQNGSPMVPPPIDPQAGGPTAPGNIEKMLQTNMGGPTGPPSTPQRRALPPWGDSQGDTPQGPAAGPFDHDYTAGNAFQPPSPTSSPVLSRLDMKSRFDAGTSGPLIMLKLLKSMGQLP